MKTVQPLSRASLCFSVSWVLAHMSVWQSFSILLLSHLFSIPLSTSLCHHCAPLSAHCVPGLVGWSEGEEWMRNVPKKETQDQVLAKKPYKGCDLHSFTACFLHHSGYLCYFAVRALALLWICSALWLLGGRSLYLPEFFPL